MSTRPFLSAWGARAMLLAGALLLGACTTPRYVIQAPANTGSVACTPNAAGTCQIAAQVAWQGVSVHPAPELWLDGTLVPGALAAPPNASFVRGVLGMAPGPHRIDVNGLLSDGVSIKTYSAMTSFTVDPPPGSFSLAGSVPALLVERMKSGSVTVTIARTAPFSGPVTVSVTGLPNGVTAGALTIPSGQTSGSISLSAGAAATFGKTQLSLRGSGGGAVPVATVPLALTVGRASGNFAEANPTPYASSLPSSKTSRSGTFRVDVSVGTTTLPQPRKAVFFRGAQQLGQEIGFTLGPVSTLGGAGFCDDAAAGALARGVVLSGALPGFASQNVVTFIDLLGSAHLLRQVPADMQSSAPTPHVFQPRVFFSPDCSLALVAGVNRLGPQKHVLRVLDLQTGSPIGSEVNFDTPVFAAKIKATGVVQQLEINVDTGATSAHTVNVNLP